MILASAALCAAGQAASISVRVTVLDEAYLLMGFEPDPSNPGEFVSRWGSRNFDVNGDGVDDIGFAHSPQDAVDVMMNNGTELLQAKPGGPGALGGVAARLDEGTFISSTLEAPLFEFFARSPTGGYDPATGNWAEGFPGPELEPFFSIPLPFDSNLYGTGLRGPQLWGFGAEGYLGFRTLEDDGWHYGWLKIERRDLDYGGGGYVVAHAWETEPDTPILARLTVPEPTTFLLVLMSSIAAARIRKRTSS
jgi:hypothetical protein